MNSMSRSYKETPFISFVYCSSKSVKDWKDSYNRTYRRKFKQDLHLSRLNDYEPFYSENIYKQSYSDIWLSPYDGKYYHPLYTKDEYEYTFINNLWKSYEDYKLWYFKTYIRK